MSKMVPGFYRLSTILAAGLTLLPVHYTRAQTTISASQTTPVSTSKTGDLTIGTAGAITITSGAAVTVNSNNTVDNQGTITGNDGKNMVGILATTGATSSITNDGTITITDSTLATTIPLTNGSYRYGIEVNAPSQFNGSITNSATGVITVRGNNSAGIAINQGGLVGSIVDAGTIGITGNSSYGILSTANTPINGSVTVTNTITALGTGSGGIKLDGSVGGSLDIDSTVQADGFYNNGVTTVRPTTFTGLVADNFLLGGSAVSVTADIKGGILVDTSGDVVSYGSAPALIIDPATGNSATIGATSTGAAGLLINGSVHGNGIYDTISATAIQIGGAGGTVAVTNGITNIGTVSATSYAANATAISIGSGATVTSLTNSGTISSTVNFGQDTNAAVGGTATAVLVNGGALSTITNTGTITATTANGQAIAFDLTGNTTFVTLTQGASASTTASSITGDILFGSKGAALNLDSGTLTGAVSFGNSLNNTLTIDNGAILGGSVSQAAGGQLALDIKDGRFSNESLGSLTLKSLSVSSTGQIDFATDPLTGKNGSADVVGAVLIASGAKIGLNIDAQLTAPQTFQLIQVTGTGTLIGQPSFLLGDVPYFYDAKIITDAAGGTISVSVRDRTFAEAGVLGSASAYNAVFSASYLDPSIRNVFDAAGTQPAFRRLYQQMLPSYNGGLFEVLSQGADALARTEAGNAIVETGTRSGGWAQQFGFGAEQSTNAAPGYHGGGLGFAFGWETPASPISTWGISVSYMRASVSDFNTGPDNQEIGTVYSAGVYWREVDGPFRTNASINAGVAEMNSTRNFSGADLTGTAVSLSNSAAWTGGIADAHLDVSYEQPLGAFYVKPSVAGDFFMLYEGSRAERGGGSGFDLNVDSSTGKQGAVTGGLSFGMQLGDKDFSWRPEVMVGYKQVFGGADDITAAFAGGSSFTLSPASQDGGAIAHVGIHGGNKYSDFAFEAGGEDRGDYRSFDGRVVARFQF